MLVLQLRLVQFSCINLFYSISCETETGCDNCCRTERIWLAR